MVTGSDEALELRGQHHVHEDDRKPEGEHEQQRVAAELLAAADWAGGIAGGLARLASLRTYLSTGVKSFANNDLRF